MILSRRSKLWLVVALTLVASQAIAALVLPRGSALTTVSDATQCMLLLSATLACLPNAWQARGRVRIFWLLLAAGFTLWLSYQVLWTYLEVYLRRDVPDLFLGDVLMFLHVVPLMAALALEPHRSLEDRAMRFNSLDFALLLIWWLYLYCYMVIPWFAASPDVDAYNHTQNLTYTLEKIVFLAALALVWKRSGREWRKIYAPLFGASLVYALSSYLANWAIERNVYYSGSLYDLPLAVSVAWFTATALFAYDLAPKQEKVRTAAESAVWVARLAMIAVFSLPLFAVYTLFDPAPHLAVRNFRLLLTLGTMLLMGAMVFLKQHLLDRELLSLVETSQDAFGNLQRLHAQMVQSEKMASLGRLVGGAAHELNNPITAMSGYAELLTASGLDAAQRALAEKIGHQVRQVKGAVANLLSFTKNVPSDKAALDLSVLAQTAVKISQPQLASKNIELHCELTPDLPQVWGDSTQLLQVCLHLLTDTLWTLPEGVHKAILVSTQRADGFVVLEFSDFRIGSADRTDPASAAEAANLDKAMGFTACCGVVREHDGKMTRLNRLDGGNKYRIELPAYNGSKNPNLQSQ